MVRAIGLQKMGAQKLSQFQEYLVKDGTQKRGKFTAVLGQLGF